MYKIPIVVVAYNREEPLQRLLNSLANANYDHKLIQLIISIDKSDNEKILEIAEKFQWNHGEKSIKKHDKHLGLKEHILKCGDIALDNDAVIILEDDLYVSVSFYKYAQESVNFYKGDQNISGISLYSYKVNEFARLRPFIPLEDDCDIYLAQFPSSWGQIWTKEQWIAFKDWYVLSDYERRDYRGIVPAKVLNWAESSWKKYFFMYMASTEKFFVYPRVSLSTNMHEIGTHNFVSTNAYQAKLMGTFKRNYIFKNSSDFSVIKYDPFFENINVKEYIEKSPKNIKVDYFGEKKRYCQNGLLLSVEKLDYVTIKSWNLVLVPYELNIMHDIQGDGIYLYDLSRKINTKCYSNAVKLSKYEYPGLTRDRARNIALYQYYNDIKRKLHFLRSTLISRH